jgi:hypothetical protein
MRIVNVTYHQEKEGWWAESVDVPSFYAAGVNRYELRQHALDYLPGIVGAPVELREAEFTIGPVLEPVARENEYAPALAEGLIFSWIGTPSLGTA